MFSSNCSPYRCTCR